MSTLEQLPTAAVLPATAIFVPATICSRFGWGDGEALRYPLYSFTADWVMFKDILLGRLSIRR